jgi:uncharacterized membrane protein YbhN (UPF0104 family)
VLSSRWFKTGISLGLFALLLRSTDLRGFTQHVLTARPEFFLLAFIGYLASQVLSAYRWRLLAGPLGFDQPLGAFTVYYFVGMYLNLFAPSTVVGDLGRGLLLAGNGGGRGVALQSVLADRVSGLVMLLWVSAAGFLLCGPTVLPAALGNGIIAAAVLSVAGWWILPRVVGRLCSPASAPRRLVEKFFVPYQTEAVLLGRACGLSFVFHLFQLSLQVLLAHALGLVVPFWYLTLFIPLVHILSALPLSFGGLGVREGGYVVFLALIGISKDDALAFGLLWSALVFGAGLVGGVVLLLSPAARLSLTGARKTTDGSG